MLSVEDRLAIVDVVVVEGETLPAVGATADITDDLRKVDGVWKLTRHHVAIDPAMAHAIAQAAAAE